MTHRRATAGTPRWAGLALDLALGVCLILLASVARPWADVDVA